MAEPKNPFDFGTGSIDKDQWLRDIDAEQDEFVSRYSNAVNKHRATLLRDAFTDLRRRIANGDMLNRTADGLYQFGSALNREDKHMQEAYQRALGFMGGLARRQIQAPPAAEPEKKKYSTKTLNDRFIKYFNPSGSQESFTSLWNSYDDATRVNNIKKFLQDELNTGLNNYLDVEDYESLDKLKTVINDFIADPNITNLNKLGFTKNYLSLLQTEELLKEEPKTDEEIATKAYNEQLTLRKVALLNNMTNFMLLASPEIWYNFSTPLYDSTQFDNMLKEAWATGGAEIDKYKNPYSVENAYSNNVGSMPLNFINDYISNFSKNLDDYFGNLSTKYNSMYADDKNKLALNLAYLFRKNKEGKYTYNEMLLKYLTPLNDGSFLINGSEDKTSGRYARYIPGKGIVEESIGNTYTKRDDLDNIFNITRQKNGGVLKAQYGTALLDFNEDLEEPLPKAISKPKQTSTPKQENSSFSTAENARIAATIADIASMGAAFVPGYGTATSAILGFGSTATNFGADLADGQGLWGATKNAGFGLAADVMGLIPGLGGVGKGAKIARNLMWAVPKMMQWVNTYQGLQNAGEIKKSIIKLASPSSMTVQDWLNVSQALQIMTGHGRSVATKIKKAGMSKTTTTTEPEYYIFTNKGKQKVFDETFKRLKETRGTKARQALTLELMGEGVTLQQTRFAPWNTSTRFGAFKEVPGKTKVEIKNKHKGWFSDENLVEKAENFNPSVDIRSILSKVNPYRTYYNNRVPKSSPLPEYLQRPVDILPQGFGVTKSGMAAGGFDVNKPKRKPLTEELKATRKLKADAKKQEQKAKELENLRRLQMYGMSEEIPQASSRAISVQRKLEQVNLNSRFANEVEMPGPQRETLKNKFYRRYGNAVRGHQIGGILKALRNGGIIKAQEGLKTDGLTNKYDNISDWTKLNFGVAEKLYFPGFMKARYDNRGNVLYPHSSFSELEEGEHFGDQSTDSAYKALQAYYLKDNGSHIFGDVLNAYNTWKSKNNGTVQDFINYYNGEVDWLRSWGLKKLLSEANSKGWKDYNLRFNNLYGSYSPYDSKLEDIIGESTWQRTPNTFKGITDLADLRLGVLGVGDNATLVAIDNLGHLITDNLINPKGDIEESKKENDKELASVADSEESIDTLYNTKFKNPTDPTPFIIGAKTIQGLLGNKNIYGNLLDEMPQAPLRDPINRQLAIVGWQEQIKQGQNQLADLRHATWMQHGADQQTNLAGMHEVENKGRDIMNDKLMKDSGRQFETAQKLWNLKNEDVLYNLGVGDANRRSIADRARMMAQIRAAWRSGDNNILMGAMSDTGNWLLKKYQREQDIVNLAREQLLGTKELFMEDYIKLKNPNYAALKTEYETTDDINRKKLIATLILEMQLEALRKAPSAWALKIYSNFHTPGFGGGYKESLVAKDGTKLEIAKLKARSKDNDRYVSMMKDLRTTRSRRRRR